MEYGRDQPIAEPILEKIARALRIELTETLRHEVYSTIIGTTLMTVRKWYSPRKTPRAAQGPKTRSAGNDLALAGRVLFAEFVIQTIQDQASTATLRPRDIIKRPTLRRFARLFHAGVPTRKRARSFLMFVVGTAHRHGDTLALPPRDDSRGQLTTPLFEFGSKMRHLVVDYGNAILDRRGLPRGRFGGFSRLNRSQLIGCLEAARRVIREEKSIGSVNSTI